VLHREESINNFVDCVLHREESVRIASLEIHVTKGQDPESQTEDLNFYIPIATRLKL